MFPDKLPGEDDAVHCRRMQMFCYKDYEASTSGGGCLGISDWMLEEIFIERENKMLEMCTHAGVVSREECPRCKPPGSINMRHTCHAVECEVEIPPKMHMCLHHWKMVPKFVQDLIWRHYRSGQEIDKQPTIEYLCVAFTAISCVALKEGKQLPKF